METLPPTHAIAKPLSQNKAVLFCLLQAKGRYVALPELSDYTARRCLSRSMNIHSRISQLRAKGYVIHNRIERTKSGRQMSMYKLVLCDVCGSSDITEAPHKGINCNFCNPL